MEVEKKPLFDPWTAGWRGVGEGEWGEWGNGGDGEMGKW